jgi:hypothetical protein
MPDQAAFALDATLRKLPKAPEFAYRKFVNDRVPTELLAGERADVSWITSEEPDRAGEVVLARGMDDRQFNLNPIVTLNHAYHMPPVGQSLWRLPSLDNGRRGIKAKTNYPPRPTDWTDGAWPPDAAFSLVQAGLLRGKSIGFLPTKVHFPTANERERLGWSDVQLVIDEWLLVEYACCFLPCQQNAVVEAVSKSLPVPDDFLRAAGIDPTLLRPPAETAPPPGFTFTPLEEVEKALCRALHHTNFTDLALNILLAQLDRACGRV